MFFAWDDWNESHIGKHRVDLVEAEYVVRAARRPYPRRISSDKYIVKGTTKAGRWLQVIYVRRTGRSIRLQDVKPEDLPALQAGEPAVYVIHARDLRPHER